MNWWQAIITTLAIFYGSLGLIVGIMRLLIWAETHQERAIARERERLYREIFGVED